MLRNLILYGLVIVGLPLALAIPAQAASSTPDGRVSVAQVMEMADAAPTKPQALQVLTAYLAGLGEAAGILTATTDAKGHRYVSCARPVAVDGVSAIKALWAASPEKARWKETPATPIILAEIIDRAGCK